ncbi:MAG: hypothetical protein K0U15_04690 [Proteobacteria bacterium]|nr:hypothetical protein [Pseudomonadota bacterium]
MQTAQQIVHNLLAVVAQQQPLANAHALLAEDVAIFMDGRQIARGKSGWFRWVHYLQQRAKRTMPDLAMHIDATEQQTDGDLRITAHWQATINGVVQSSASGVVIYSIRNGQVSRIQTHRRNYTFIHGQSIARSWVAFYFLVLRMLLSPAPDVPAATVATN